MERSFDSDLAMLKWTKKGTKMQAVCHPTSMICDIIGHSSQGGDLSDLLGRSGLDKQATRDQASMTSRNTSRVGTLTLA